MNALIRGPESNPKWASYTSGCFVCGTDNPSGMRLTFRLEGDKYVSEFTVAKAYQGFPGIMHGGVISTVLDEIMGRFLWVKGYVTYTAEMTVKFRRPIMCGTKIRVEGEILEVKGRRFYTAGRILSEDGAVMAEATGCFVSKRDRPALDLAAQDSTEEAV
ncbi:MAG: PaaI family thioesterase [Firmicutes bacterium]|nr:PaaI family thioesterase [Bacillota bacterium]